MGNFYVIDKKPFKRPLESLTILERAKLPITMENGQLVLNKVIKQTKCTNNSK
jgi:hypothetical protein